MKEFKTFLGLFLSRAQARDKNRPRKVENSFIKWISQAQIIFIQKRFQPRYRKFYILLFSTRKSAKHWGEKSAKRFYQQNIFSWPEFVIQNTHISHKLEMLHNFKVQQFIYKRSGLRGIGDSLLQKRWSFCLTLLILLFTHT